MAEEHPDLFAQAMAYEQNHSDGRTFTWSQGESLVELIARKDQIVADHEKAMQRELAQKPNQPLAQALESILDDEDDTLPCLSCHL